MKTKGIHTGHRQRLKQRALSFGLESMPEHEVLEWLLTYTIPYKDVNPLAHQLIEQFGSYAGVLEAGYDQLKSISGVGHETAAFLSLLPEAYRTYLSSRNVGTIVLNNVYECINYFKTFIISKDVEQLYIFCLDGKYQLKKTIKVLKGKENHVEIPLKEFTEKIAGEKYVYALLMHTHTGSNVKPTEADVTATLRFMTICQSMGMKLHDHIIMNENKYYSFRNNGVIDDMERGIQSSMLGTTMTIVEQIGLRDKNDKK